MILHLVVNGTECVVHAHPSDTLREIVDIALKFTGYARDDQHQWETRDNDGMLLREDVTIENLAYMNHETDRIYVSLPAGVGA